MKRSIKHIIYLLLVMLWVYAAVSKLADYGLFIKQLDRQPLPDWSASILSWLLPTAELVTALLLSFERTRNYGLATSCVMLTSFTIYTGLALSRAYGSIPCSYGGIFSFMQWKGHLIFNAAATTAAFSGWKMSRKEMPKTVISNPKYYAHNGKEAENP
jgi:hypothetical protein